MKTFTYERLTQVNEAIVRDINALLQHLHGKSKAYNVLDAADQNNRSITIVAKDGDTIIGMVTAAGNLAWSHGDCFIRNLIVAEKYGTEENAVSENLLALLAREIKKSRFLYVWMLVSNDHQYRHTILYNLGFEAVNKTPFKLKVPQEVTPAPSQ